MRATSSCLVALFLIALLATPALAGPREDGKQASPAAKDLQKQIQKLTKELKGLEKRLEKATKARPDAEEPGEAAATGRRFVVEQQRRMAAARRRLAGLLAERGRTDRPAAPQPPRAPKAPQVDPRRKAATHDAPKGGDAAGTLRRLQQENRRLAARVQSLEQQIRRGSAAGAGGPGRGGPGNDRPGRGGPGRGEPGRGGPGHDGQARGGPGRGPQAEHAQKGPPGGPPSIEARLQRLEGALRALMARAGRGDTRGGWARARGREGRKANQARLARGKARGRWGMAPGPGSRGGMARQAQPGRGHGRKARGAQGGGPRWSRMLPSDRMHRSAARGPDGPSRGRRASGRYGGRMGQGAMKRGRGQHAGSCPFCGS